MARAGEHVSCPGRNASTPRSIRQNCVASLPSATGYLAGAGAGVGAGPSPLGPFALWWRCLLCRLRALLLCRRLAFFAIFGASGFEASGFAASGFGASGFGAWVFGVSGGSGSELGSATAVPASARTNGSVRSSARSMTWSATGSSITGQVARMQSPRDVADRNDPARRADAAVASVECAGPRTAADLNVRWHDPWNATAHAFLARCPRGSARRLPIGSASEQRRRQRCRDRCRRRRGWLVSTGPDLYGDDPVSRHRHRRDALRRLRDRRLDHRHADDRVRRRVRGDRPGERRASHPLQVPGRRRGVDQRPRQHAHEPRRLRRQQLGHPRRLRSLSRPADDGLARRHHVLPTDRSVQRRRHEQRHDGARRRAPRPVPGRRLRRHHAEDHVRLLHRPRDQHDLDHVAAREHVARRARLRRSRILGLSRLLAEGRDPDRRALRQPGRPADDDRHRARARHPDLDRLRDEPRHDRRADLSTEPRLVLARRQRLRRQLRVRPGLPGLQHGVLVRHVLADVQHARRRCAPVVGQQRDLVGQDARHRRVQARRCKAGGDSLVHRYARA